MSVMLIATWLFFLGAAFGSFSLVLAWRMHEKRDWIRGRSECDNCHRQLAALDLVPLFSWLLLGGKCRYCKKPIGTQLLLSELLVAGLFVVSYVFWPFELSSLLEIMIFVLWLIIVVLYNALLWYDLRWFLLPNKIVYPTTVFSVLFIVLLFGSGSIGRSEVLLAGITALLLSGVFWVMHMASKGKWIGFGDVRLAWSIGLIVATPLHAWLMLFVASLLGLLFALPSMLRGKRKFQSKIPFGPMLILSTIFIFLIGDRLIDWHMAFSGL